MDFSAGGTLVFVSAQDKDVKTLYFLDERSFFHTLAKILCNQHWGPYPPALLYSQSWQQHVGTIRSTRTRLNVTFFSLNEVHVEMNKILI